MLDEALATGHPKPRQAGVSGERRVHLFDRVAERGPELRIEPAPGVLQ